MPVESESRRHEDWYAEERAKAKPGDVSRPFEIETGISLTIELDRDEPLEAGYHTDSGGRLEIVADPVQWEGDDPHIWIEYVSSDGDSSVTLYVDRAELAVLIDHLQAAKANVDAALGNGGDA